MAGGAAGMPSVAKSKTEAILSQVRRDVHCQVYFFVRVFFQFCIQLVPRVGAHKTVEREIVRAAHEKVGSIVHMHHRAISALRAAFDKCFFFPIFVLWSFWSLFSNRVVVRSENSRWRQTVTESGCGQRNAGASGDKSNRQLASV